MTFQAEEDHYQEINGLGKDTHPTLGRKAKAATYMGVSKQSSIIPNMESSNGDGDGDDGDGDDDDDDDSNPSFNTYTHGPSGTESHHHYTSEDPPIWTKNKNNKHY